MDIEKRKHDFQQHHKHPVNIVFHILCGIVYISLFFTLFPRPAYYAYVLVTLAFFPYISVFTVLVLMTFLRKHLVLSPILSISGVVLIYLLPELSHYMTGEDTVLKINTVSAFDIIDNFFFLLPHSILALTKASY